MSCLSDYAQNKITDALLRGQALGAPATLYHSLLTCSKGARANSTAYSLNDTIAVTANDGIIHLYKATTGGTTAASQSTLYPGAVGESITDGTAVFTEQSNALDAGTLVEVTGGSFARVAVTASLANYSGTQGASTTVASSGTTGTTSNNNTITFANPTGQWVPAGGAIWGIAVFDASTSGNLWLWAPMLALKTSISSGDPGPTIAPAALSWRFGS